MKKPGKKTAGPLIREPGKSVNKTPSGVGGLLQNVNSAETMLKAFVDTVQAVTGVLKEKEITKQVIATCEMEIEKAKEKTAQVREISSTKKEEIWADDRKDERRHIEAMSVLQQVDRQQIFEMMHQHEQVEKILGECKFEQPHHVSHMVHLKEK